MANELGTINTRTSVVDSAGGFAKLVAGDDLVIDKASSTGIKVDLTTPTFGFADIIGNILSAKTAAANIPTLATYQGGLKQLQFVLNDLVFINFHIPHDYAPGTDIFIHSHWSHIATTVTGGSVDWSFECSYAKGHNQAAFGAPITAVGTSNASVTQYQHILTDIQLSAAAPSGTQLDTDNIEPDGIIMCRIYLSANNITVSGGGVPDPFLHFVDIHYQTTGMIGTKNKSPDFYA